MLQFFWAIVRRFGRYLFGLGVVFTGLSVLFAVTQIDLYTSGVEVQAQVVQVRTLCTLRWKDESGRRTSDEMPCDQARAIKAADPLKGYRLIERTQSLLAYALPDGKGHQSWSAYKGADGTPPALGTTVTVLVDPADPEVARRANELWDFGGPAVMLVGSLAALAIGMLGMNAGRRRRDRYHGPDRVRQMQAAVDLQRSLATDGRSRTSSPGSTGARAQCSGAECHPPVSPGG